MTHFTSVILFLHHANDELTRRHFALLQQLNPFPVIAIHAHQPGHLPEAIDIGPIDNIWHNTDTPMVQWFRTRPMDAERYIFVEYDTLATLPFREFYGGLWDKDAVAPHIRVGRLEPHWEWFRQISLLPPELQPLATGVSPMSPILLSHRALEAISTLERPPVLSELRLGTLLRAAKIEITALPRHLACNIHWDPRQIGIDPDVPGIYHPVKALIPVRVPGPSVSPVG